jgi:hypothetical protein
MNRHSNLRLFVVALTLASVAHPTTTRACAMCMGGADSHNGAALNGAIFLMLGLLVAMFSAIIAVAVSFVRRARNPLAPHVEFTDPNLSEGKETLS